MSAALEVIEGTWDEISRQANRLKGHRLRVTILADANQTMTIQRLQRLNEWLNMPRPAVPAIVDDSREAIYDEDEDRG